MAPAGAGQPTEGRWSSLTSGLRALLRPAGLAGGAVLDLLLPPQCATCDAPVQTQGQLCATCFGALTFIGAPICRRCGSPFAAADQGGLDSICEPCRVHPPVFGTARAALIYDAAARRLILPFKHADRTELARVLAPHMARAGATLLAGGPILVPVPLHRGRLLFRRYNQAALLAWEIGRRSGVAVLPDALRRLRATESLGHHGAAERAAILADAFAVRTRRRAALAGRTVLLVDDVMTSGATANEAARTLLQAGVAAVDVLVAGRVPHPAG